MLQIKRFSTNIFIGDYMELLNNSTFILNIILVVIFIFFVFRGYRKGVITQFFMLFTLVGAIFIAWFLYKPFGALFKITPAFLVPFQDTVLEQFFYTKVNGYVWFIILFVIAFIFLKFLKVVFNTISKVPGLSLVNKILGMAFGVVNYVIVAFVMIYIISMPIFTNGVSMVEHSLLNPIVQMTNKIVPTINNRLTEFEVFDILMSDAKQATIEDVENMQHYLEKNNISVENITQFINEVTQ